MLWVVLDAMPPPTMPVSQHVRAVWQRAYADAENGRSACATAHFLWAIFAVWPQAFWASPHKRLLPEVLARGITQAARLAEGEDALVTMWAHAGHVMAITQSQEVTLAHLLIALCRLPRTWSYRAIVASGLDVARVRTLAWRRAIDALRPEAPADALPMPTDGTQVGRHRCNTQKVANLTSLRASKAATDGDFNARGAETKTHGIASRLKTSTGLLEQLVAMVGALEVKHGVRVTYSQAVIDHLIERAHGADTAWVGATLKQEVWSPIERLVAKGALYAPGSVAMCIHKKDGALRMYVGLSGWLKGRVRRRQKMA